MLWLLKVSTVQKEVGGKKSSSGSESPRLRGRPTGVLLFPAISCCCCQVLLTSRIGMVKVGRRVSRGVCDWAAAAVAAACCCQVFL